MKKEIIIKQSDILNDMINYIDTDIEFFKDSGFGNTKKEIINKLIKSDTYMKSDDIHYSYLMLYNWIQLSDDKSKKINDYNVIKYNLNIINRNEFIIEITSFFKDAYKSTYTDINSKNDIKSDNDYVYEYNDKQTDSMNVLEKDGYKFAYTKDDEGYEIIMMKKGNEYASIDQNGNID